MVTKELEELIKKLKVKKRPTKETRDLLNKWCLNHLIKTGDVLVYPLTGRDGKHQLISKKSYDLMKKYTWSYCYKGYATSKIEGINWYAQRFLKNCKVGDGVEVDHIDGDRNLLPQRRTRRRVNIVSRSLSGRVAATFTSGSRDGIEKCVHRSACS